MVAAGLSLLRIYDMPTTVSTDDPQASLIISSLSFGILSRSLESRDSLSTVELDSVSTGYSKDNVTVHADWRIYFYFIFQIVGAIGLTVLLVTMLWPSKQRKPRNPLLLSLCFSWWISTFPCLCLLYYAGQVTGPPPSFGVCLSSAALTMAQQVLVATTAPALVFHVWLVVKKAVSARFSSDNWMYWTTIICVSVPYVLFLIFACATIGMGLKEPDLVYRVVFYCTVNDIQLMEALGVVGTCGMVISVIFEIWTVLLLRRNKARIQQLSKDRTTFDMSLIIRVCIFGIYVLLGLCLNIISIIDWANPIPDLFFSTFSLAVFVVFGSQRDVWRIWKNVPRNITTTISQTHTHSNSQGSPNVGPANVTTRSSKRTSVLERISRKSLTRGRRNPSISVQLHDDDHEIKVVHLSCDRDFSPGDNSFVRMTGEGGSSVEHKTKPKGAFQFVAVGVADRRQGMHDTESDIGYELQSINLPETSGSPMKGVLGHGLGGNSLASFGYFEEGVRMSGFDDDLDGPVHVGNDQGQDGPGKLSKSSIEIPIYPVPRASRRKQSSSISSPNHDMSSSASSPSAQYHSPPSSAIPLMAHVRNHHPFSSSVSSPTSLASPHPFAQSPSTMVYPHSHIPPDSPTVSPTSAHPYAYATSTRTTLLSGGQNGLGNTDSSGMLNVGRFDGELRFSYVLTEAQGETRGVLPFIRTESSNAGSDVEGQIWNAI